jgi:hypothetical protein
LEISAEGIELNFLEAVCTEVLLGGAEEACIETDRVKAGRRSPCAALEMLETDSDLGPLMAELFRLLCSVFFESEFLR